MTKRKFIEDATALLEANPRKVLAGHGITGAMLSKITKRVDVMKFLCGVLYTLRTAKKGAIGLKKTNLFQIKAYKNFADLNTKARIDVEKFMVGLKGKDAEDFTNADNILTIVFGEQKGMVTGPEGDDIIEGMIANSAMLKFDSAVRKEYKIPGVSYVVVMIAPSAIRPAEEKLAKRVSKRTERKNNIQDKAAKVRSRMKKQARKALARLKADRVRLEDRQYGLAAQNAQYEYLTKKTGADDLWTGLQMMNAASAQKVAKTLGSADARLYMTAMKMAENGMEDEAKLILSKIKNKRAIKAAMAGNGGNAGNAMIDARRKELAKTIKRLEAKLDQLKVDLALAPAQKRTSVKSMISKYSAQIKQLKARMKFYANKNNMAMGGKAQQLAQVRAAIEENIAQGKAISQALNAGLAQLEASPKVKQQIKQQIVHQVADGLPMQYAVQQAIQELPVDDVELTGSVDFEDLINALES